LISSKFLKFEVQKPSWIVFHSCIKDFGGLSSLDLEMYGVGANNEFDENDEIDGNTNLFSN